MADEELEVDVEQKQKKKERPIRRIAVRDSDVNRTLRDEVIEITQQTLDDTERACLSTRIPHSASNRGWTRRRVGCGMSS